MSSERTPAAVDGSTLEVSLSSPGVTPGEVSTLVVTARNVLNETGTSSYINGLPAKVSSINVPVQIGEKLYYARVAQFKKDPLDKKIKTLPFVVFDETPDIEVYTANMRAVRFQRMGSHVSLVTDNDLNPSVDDPQQVETIKEILQGLAAQTTKGTSAKLENRKTFWQNIRREVGHWVPRGGAAVAGFAIVAASGWHLSNVDWEEFFDGTGTPFDKRGIELTGGNSYGIGEHGAPAYSEEMFNNPDLSLIEVPELDEDTSLLDADEALRQVIITSSEEGDNCATIELERTDRDAQLVAWTDFTGPNGEDRSDELEVIHRTDEFEICWDGQERSDDDDPRVIVDLRPGLK